LTSVSFLKQVACGAKVSRDRSQAAPRQGCSSLTGVRLGERLLGRGQGLNLQSPVFIFFNLCFFSLLNIDQGVFATDTSRVLASKKDRWSIDLCGVRQTAHVGGAGVKGIMKNCDRMATFFSHCPSCFFQTRFGSLLLSKMSLCHQHSSPRTFSFFDFFLSFFSDLSLFFLRFFFLGSSSSSSSSLCVFFLVPSSPFFRFFSFKTTLACP